MVGSNRCRQRYSRIVDQNYMSYLGNMPACADLYFDGSWYSKSKPLEAGWSFQPALYSFHCWQAQLTLVTINYPLLVRHLKRLSCMFSWQFLTMSITCMLCWMTIKKQKNNTAQLPTSASSEEIAWSSSSRANSFNTPNLAPLFNTLCGCVRSVWRSDFDILVFLYQCAKIIVRNEEDYNIQSMY